MRWCLVMLAVRACVVRYEICEKREETESKRKGEREREREIFIFSFRQKEKLI